MLFYSNSYLPGKDQITTAVANPIAHHHGLWESPLSKCSSQHLVKILLYNARSPKLHEHTMVDEHQQARSIWYQSGHENLTLDNVCKSILDHLERRIHHQNLQTKLFSYRQLCLSKPLDSPTVSSRQIHFTIFSLFHAMSLSKLLTPDHVILQQTCPSSRYWRFKTGTQPPKS